MTYAEFIAAVRTHLTVDSNRKGAESMVASLITNGILDLQTYIEGYKEGHLDVYLPDDFIDDWFASKGDLPAGAYICQCFIVKSKSKEITAVDSSTDIITVIGHGIALPEIENAAVTGVINNSLGAVPAGTTDNRAYFLRPSGDDGLTLHTTAKDAVDGTRIVDITDSGSGTNTLNYRRTRHECIDVGWDDRYSLLTGSIPVNDNLGRISIEPMASTFYVYPCVRSIDENDYSYQFELHWDGKKSEWENTDVVKFTLEDARVVANYVKIEMERTVKRDLAMSASFETSHRRGRSTSYLDAKDRARIRY